jgi:hypothetical protein
LRFQKIEMRDQNIELRDQKTELMNQEKLSKNEGAGPEEQERDQKTGPIDQKLELNY